MQTRKKFTSITEFNMKTNLEVNLGVTFLYELLLLKLFLLALYLRLMRETKIQTMYSKGRFSITDSLRGCSVYTSVCMPSPPRREAAERQATDQLQALQGYGCPAFYLEGILCFPVK